MFIIKFDNISKGISPAKFLSRTFERSQRIMEQQLPRRYKFLIIQYEEFVGFRLGEIK